MVKELLNRHLEGLSIAMGGFLRGFDNPAVHLGSAARFAAEFRKVLDYPALHPPAAERPISYSRAAESYSAPPVESAGWKPADPVSLMVQGLNVSPTISAGDRADFPLEGLRNDLTALLRVPLLLFYIQVSNSGTFFAALDEIARKDNFPLVRGPRGSATVCPLCGRLLPVPVQGPALRCISCGQPLAVFAPLPLVAGVAASISYEMLRQIVAMDLVESYQEEGDIRPLISGSEILT